MQAVLLENMFELLSEDVKRNRSNSLALVTHKFSYTDPFLLYMLLEIEGKMLPLIVVYNSYTMSISG